MSKKRSLFVQSMTAVEASFTLGYDKHSAKKQSGQPDHSWRVYSFAGKANLLDTAHNLCEYIKEHYPEVDKVRQIRPEYCQEWLDSKAKGGCSLNTIETYKSNLVKLSRVINHHFGVHTNFETKVNVELIPDRTSPREFVLTPEEIQRVKDSIVKPFHSSNFFIFSTYTCCRVNSVSIQKRHITLGNDGVSVMVFFEKDKGGRSREITVTDKEFYAFCSSLISGKAETDFLFGSKSEFNRLCLELVTKLKEKYPHVKRIYVRAEFPFIDDDYLNYLLNYYNDTYYSEKFRGSGRAIYVERNCEMINQSGFCIVYCDRRSGKFTVKSGTGIAIDYAIGKKEPS